MPAQFLRDLGAVHIGQADIQQNQIRMVFQCGGDPAPPFDRELRPSTDAFAVRFDSSSMHLDQPCRYHPASG
jgi:hypothetical protein